MTLIFPECIYFLGMSFVSMSRLLPIRNVALTGQRRRCSQISSESVLSHRDFFGVSNLFSVSDLFNARVHLGHAASATDPRMRQFVFGKRFGHAVIDLDQTALLLRQALNFTAHLAHRGGIILFVARQPHLTHTVEKAAMECGEFAHCRNWKGNMFSSYGANVRLPDLVVLVNTRDGVKYDPHPAIADAAKFGVPTAAVVDTDCNPNIVSYPIPGNDDSIQAVQLYLNLFKEAIWAGKKQREKEFNLEEEKRIDEATKLKQIISRNEE